MILSVPNVVILMVVGLLGVGIYALLTVRNLTVVLQF